MIAYISVSFSKRKSAEGEITAICEALMSFRITPFIFVDSYRFGKSQEMQMMEQAMSDINKCDMLIAETSDKAIGIGVEVGYAKAKNKPVVYIRQKDAEHSTTVSGVSDFQIIYTSTDDLRRQLSGVLQEILVTLN